MEFPLQRYNGVGKEQNHVCQISRKLNEGNSAEISQIREWKYSLQLWY